MTVITSGGSDGGGVEDAEADPRLGERGRPIGADDRADPTAWLATAIEGDRDLILRAYLDELEVLDNAIVHDECALAQALVVVCQILDEVAADLRSGAETAAAACRKAHGEGRPCSVAGVHPRESLQAVSVFFRTVLDRVARRVSARPDASSLVSEVAVALERSIMAKLSASSVAYTSNLLDELHDAQLAERRRIARDLHDRLGQCISVTHQQMELFNLCLDLDLDKAAEKVKAAQRAVIESMLNLRAFTSALYDFNPLKSLVTALEPYLDEVPGRTLEAAAATQKISVALVDDHVLVREGIREILAGEGDIVVVAEAATSEEALAVVAEHRPDLVLLEAEIPGRPVAEIVVTMREISPRSRIVVLSMSDSPATLRPLIAAGINGYLLKSVDRQELVLAIRTVHQKPDRTVLSISRETLPRLQGPEEQVLSVRELAILRLVAQALSNSQIATRLQVSEASVKRHLHSVFVKLGAVSRIDAVNKAVAAALITTDAY